MGSNPVLDTMNTVFKGQRVRISFDIDDTLACQPHHSAAEDSKLPECVHRWLGEPLRNGTRALIRELRRQKAAIDQAFRRLVAAGVQEGSLAPCDPKMTAFVIAGALSWIGRWYQPGGQYSAEEVAQQCIDTLMGGVLRRAQPARRAASAKRAANPSKD